MEHISVLLNEAIDSLGIKPDGIYVDATLGRAGHSSKILEKIPNGHLYCFDKDETAIKESQEKLTRIASNFTIIHSDFSCLKEELEKLGVSKVDGILADLGVSSPQFDDPSRGFSYRYEARLDMRMDQSKSLDAYYVINNYEVGHLAKIISDYGEDKDAYKIAKAIEKQRSLQPIVTTFDLVEIIKKAKSPKELAKKGHPAKQTFQAIRIEVNDEKGALEALLRDGPGLLKKDGRLSIITFMSLDDRLVKKAYQNLTVIEGDRKGFILPKDIKTPDYHLLTKKPILPSLEEEKANPRSASAKLRTLVRD